MNESVFSPAWYRVAGLRPALQGHVRVHRHEYRRTRWYVLENLADERFFRFTPEAYQIIGRMDGLRTVQELWDDALSALGDDAPTQGEVIRMLGQLHQGDLLRCDIPPDVEVLSHRHDQHARGERKRRLLSPFCWRVPLLDPERMLAAARPVARFLFSWPALALWLVIVAGSFALAILHWEGLTTNVAQRVLTPENLFVLWLLFPVFKVFHEAGHALAVKAFGGEVHEVGVMVLFFTPVPYVDASASSGFHSKIERILVSAAGSMMDLLTASAALAVWVSVGDGPLRHMAYNVLFLSGVSAVLFNANPLMRFDGYHVLMDLLEIPNLATRSRSYVRFLAERFLFGVRELQSPAETRGEAAWMVTYFVTSFVYRMVVLCTIAFFLASKFFFVGVGLAVWGAFQWFVLPVLQGIRYLFRSSIIERRRVRAWTVSAGLAGAAVLLLLALPFPLRTYAKGAIRLPDHASVRMATEGFIDRVVCESGSSVREGQPLIVCGDPEIDREIRVLEFELRALESERDAVQADDPIQARQLEDQIAYARKALDREIRRKGELVIHSRTSGVFHGVTLENLEGRFLRKGEEIGWVLSKRELRARVVVSSDYVDDVRRRTGSVTMSLARDLDDTTSTRVRREVPAAIEEDAAEVLVEGESESRYVFEVDVPRSMQSAYPGETVYVSFEHGWEPIAFRWYRSLRRLFLSRLSV